MVRSDCVYLIQEAQNAAAQLALDYLNSCTNVGPHKEGAVSPVQSYKTPLFLAAASPIES